MGYYNPYRYSGTSGSGNPGAGSAYSYGQQGSNPWQPGQRSTYGQPYNTAPNQGEYRGYQPQQGYQSPSGYGQQSPYQQQPPAGKGRGMGGFGGMPGGGIPGVDTRAYGGNRMAMQSARSRGEWDRQMEFHQMLLQQRQMEQSLGAPSGYSWYEPFTRPQLASMEYASPGAVAPSGGF